MAVAVALSVRWKATLLSQASSCAGPAPVAARPRRALRRATMPVAAPMPWPATSPTAMSTVPLGSATVSWRGGPDLAQGSEVGDEFQVVVEGIEVMVQR